MSHEHWVKITVVEDKITLEDHLGNKKVVKGAMVVAHDSDAKTLYGVATGDPTEIASGFGEVLTRRMDDPYYHVVYRAILADLMMRTGVRPDRPSPITPERAVKMFESVTEGKKETVH